MDAQAIHWWPFLWGGIKLLKGFGLLPGALAAIGVRRFYQKWRQRKAIAGWPTTEATIQSGEVHKHGTWSYWAEVAYTYHVGEYRLGHYVRHFRKEEQADDFVRQLKDRRIQVRFDEADPDNSVILDRDIEMVALLMPAGR
jgi:hypothetical protein